MTAPNGPILFNSSSGSNTAASGLGPTTAVSGTGASLNTTSTVDLSADAPNLSGVSAGDLLWVDTSSGRKFSIIASVDDGADTVTCDDAFSVTESGRNWGIGGKRLSFGGSSTLFSSGGDMKGGWVVEMESGYTETFSATFNFYPGGDTTNGPTIIRGADGAATRPVLTFSGGTIGVLCRTALQKIKGFEIASSHGAATQAVFCDTVDILIEDILVQTSGANAWDNGIQANNAGLRVYYSEIRNCSGDGIVSNISGQLHQFVGCKILDNGGHGINMSSAVSRYGINIINCILAGNTSDGVNLNNSGASAQNQGFRISGCVFEGNSGDGLDIGNLTAALAGIIEHNIFVSNGGYGLNFSNVSATNEYLDAYNCIINRNAFYNNTSGKYNPSDITSQNESVLTANPFVDAANEDYNINNISGGGAVLRAVTVTML